MSKWKIYTPTGVQDILQNDCALKNDIENKARDIFKLRGFYEIETPTIEFFDVFSIGKNSIPQESMFKFFDQEGRILVLRPDMTVPAARVAATKLKEARRPLRLSYIGNTFKYNQSGGGKQKEYTQAGIEIIGEKGAAADAEVISTAIELLLSTGIESFQIEIGQVSFFKGLMEQLGLSEEETENMRNLIDTKDYLGIESIVKDLNVLNEIKEIILSLPGMFGNIDVIDKINKSCLNKKSLEALENLKEIYDILNIYGLEKYVTVDLSMVPKLDYYTGAIFRGFTYGIGFPVVSGGRYDNLTNDFGITDAATGFSLGITMLIAAIRRQKAGKIFEPIEYFISYDITSKEARKSAFIKAKELRDKGSSVQMDVSGFDADEALSYACCQNIKKLIYISGNNVVNEFDLTAIGGN